MKILTSRDHADGNRVGKWAHAGYIIGLTHNAICMK